MISGSNQNLNGRRRARVLVHLLSMMILALTIAPIEASADVVLKLGDILIAEPATSSVSVIDAVTGQKTVISQGGLLLPAHRTVGVALALDGDVIVAHRNTGLIRVNPFTGVQSILSQGGLFKDPWAIAINKDTGYIYVADSGYDNDRPEINQAGKIIRVDPATGGQVLIASGSACNVFPSNAACQNTTSAGSYLSHPYGIAIDYTISPGSIIVADMSSFSGKGAIIRIQPVPNGTQTLLWGPSTAVPAPQVAQVSPLGCPMGVAVEPDGNILTTVFTYPVPATPAFPPPAGTFYGCTPPGIFRIDLLSNVQKVVTANAPAWQANRAYAVGAVIRDETVGSGRVHRVITAGTSQGLTPNWNSALDGTTNDGTVVWRNIGPGANWLIPFGVDAEPAPAPNEPMRYNIVVGDEGHSMLFRLNPNGEFISPTPLASSLNNVTSVDVITFTPVGGFKSEPVRSNGQPTGTLAAGTTQTSLTLATTANATCRYSTQAGVAYGSMTNTFSTTGSTTHTTTVTGLTNGTSYVFYVRCSDGSGHANSEDFPITFSVGQATFTGPVAAYGFEEGSGASVGDASGNGHTGAVSGATWSTSGKFGKALSFDGVNDWVTVNASSLLNLTTAMTLEAWVFPTASGGGSWRNVLIKERSGGEAYNLYANVDVNTPAVYVVRSADPNGPVDARGSSQLALSTWTHLAVTFDNSTLRLFVNGAQVGTRAVAGPLLTTTGALRLGGNSIWGEFFAGRLDDVRIYNRALTQGEIQNDMNTAVGGGSSADTTPPVRSNGTPAGTLAMGTTQATLSLTTSENATCRYSTQAGVSYASMTNTFTTTGSTTHSRAVTGLTNGTSYTFYVRCVDTAANANPDDFPIAFTVSQVPASGPIASYGFEEGSGPSVADVSGNGHTGTISGAIWSTSGKFGKALSFDGVNDWVTVNASPLLNLTTAMTLEAWVFPTASGGGSWRNVLIKERSAGEAYNLYANVDVNTPAVYVVRSADPNAPVDARGSSQLALNTWTHLAVTFDNSTLRLFVNGAQVGTRAVAGPLLTTTGALRLGGNSIWGEFFAGRIDDVRIYSRALTESEIQTDMNTPVAGGSSADTTPPVRSNGTPAGTLAMGTTQATLSLTTSENATCRYSTQAGVAYASMTNTFTTTGSTSHSRTVTGLTNGGSYTFHVRCVDGAANANPDDFVIAFSVATTSSTSSNFSGVENPLSEAGRWDSPGSWADLQKNAGAFAVGLNAQGRLVTPVVAADQYSEITYDQDPGVSSWVGVTTRVQSGTVGSSYLAIVYAGEVRLYRADDSGSLNFTLLASASAGIGTAPRRLRMESQGNTHRVYFNGTQVISHTASGTVYSSGQPGIAASVFGGPQVKILSFEAGNMNN